jgi:hypothetical protein
MARAKTGATTIETARTTMEMTTGMIAANTTMIERR